MEHIIAKHISESLDSNALIYSRPHGFKTGLSTTTQLVETFRDLASAMNSRKKVDVLSIDFSKAIDRVPPKILVTKLQMFGLNENIISLIEAYL